MIILVGVEISIKKNRTYELTNESAFFFFFFFIEGWIIQVYYFLKMAFFFLGLLKKSLVF